MINNNYLNGLAKLMVGESYSIPSYMAFGSTTGTLTATDTTTSGEFDRNILSSLSRSNNIAKFNGRRTSAEAGDETINVVSLVNTNSLTGTGDIQLNALTPSIVHSSSFAVDIEFWVKHERQ